ncbi:unnamed protein product [Brachionus calyciflorus]|uniref:Uncharacterized protein n=1 Tax=Brachionus calyciflorus TaxID=104777 RepID=A0A813M1Q1_9BILA|nr:unnamed protein product [Brachionus calyciflorus]
MNPAEKQRPIGTLQDINHSNCIPNKYFNQTISLLQRNNDYFPKTIYNKIIANHSNFFPINNAKSDTVAHSHNNNNITPTPTHNNNNNDNKRPTISQTTFYNTKNNSCRLEQNFNEPICIRNSPSRIDISLDKFTLSLNKPLNLLKRNDVNEKAYKLDENIRKIKCYYTNPTSLCNKKNFLE